MVEVIGKVYKEKVQGAKRVFRKVEGEKVEYYLLAEDKAKLKLLEELSYAVAYLEENSLEMAYLVHDGVVYYFTLQENYYLVEREEVKDGENLIELITNHFHGYTPPSIDESLSELKKTYGDRRQVIIIGALAGSLVLLGILVKLLMTPPAPPPAPPPQAQNQPPPPLSPEEVYKTGLLFFFDAVSQINEVIGEVREQRIGEISVQDSGGVQGDSKTYTIKWSYYYPYPAPNTRLEEGYWKREESKDFIYTRNDLATAKDFITSYECMAFILKTKNLVVLSRMGGEVEMEVKELRPSEVVEFLNGLKGRECPIYLQSLTLSGKETYLKFKVREP